MDRMSGAGSVHSARVVGIVGHAVATKATLVPAGAGAPPHLRPGDRTSRVSAAKKRSSRASKASLRIPKTPTHTTNGEQPHPRPRPRVEEAR